MRGEYETKIEDGDTKRDKSVEKKRNLGVIPRRNVCIIL